MSSLPVHYYFIARDPDMIVFEALIDKELSQLSQT